MDMRNPGKTQPARAARQWGPETPSGWRFANTQPASYTAGSDDETLVDGHIGELPKDRAWPLSQLAAPRSGGAAGHGSRRRRWLLGAGVVALVLTIAVGGVSQASRFIASNMTASQPPAVLPVATPSPTARPTPSATATLVPTAATAGLRVTPSTLTLRCATRFASRVVLTNSGTTPIEWAASVQPSARGIQVFPDHGRLAAGAHQSLFLRATTRRATGQGSILFRALESPTASPVAQLAFTSLGCR